MPASASGCNDADALGPSHQRTLRTPAGSGAAQDPAMRSRPRGPDRGAAHARVRPGAAMAQPAISSLPKGARSATEQAQNHSLSPGKDRGCRAHDPEPSAAARGGDRGFGLLPAVQRHAADASARAPRPRRGGRARHGSDRDRLRHRLRHRLRRRCAHHPRRRPHPGVRDLRRERRRRLAALSGVRRHRALVVPSRRARHLHRRPLHGRRQLDQRAHAERRARPGARPASS
jgi:hypothetical protein